MTQPSTAPALPLSPSDAPDLGSEALGAEGLGSEAFGSEGLGPEDLGSEAFEPEDLESEALESEELGSEDFNSATPPWHASQKCGAASPERGIKPGGLKAFPQRVPILGGSRLKTFTFWLLLLALNAAHPSLAAPSAPPGPSPLPGQDRCDKGPAPGCTCVHRAPHPTSLSKAPSCFLRYRSEIRPLSRAEKEAMTKVSWTATCPVPLEDLRKIRVYHWGFDGKVYQGEVVVAAPLAEGLTRVFRQLYESHFPIERLQTIEAFAGNDSASMQANNSSAFNCRKIARSEAWSRHSFGDAIDLNPVQNPYVRRQGLQPGEVEPEAGSAFLNRKDLRPGMVVEGGPALQAFEQAGWKWGGRWKSVKDYQHFSVSGR